MKKELTSLDKLLVSLLIAGPCQGGFLHIEDHSSMELRHDTLNPKIVHLGDIVTKDLTERSEIFKSDNIKVTVVEDTILGSDLKLIATVEVFDNSANIILDNLDDLKMANAIVGLIGFLCYESELSYSTICNAQSVLWHFPRTED